MAITFVEGFPFGTAGSYGQSGGSSAQVGDVMIAITAIYGNQTPNPPVGFTKLNGTPTGSSYTTSLSYQVVTTAGSQFVQFGPNSTEGAIAIYRGVDATKLIASGDTAPIAINSGSYNSTTISWPATNIAGPEILAFMFYSNNPIDGSSPSGFTTSFVTQGLYVSGNGNSSFGTWRYIFSLSNAAVTGASVPVTYGQQGSSSGWISSVSQKLSGGLTMVVG
jgi:hypothetical protein